MSKFNIGPCCTKQQMIEIDNDYWNLSNFQVERFQEIMDDPDFSYFGMPNIKSDDSIRKAGPIVVPYYLKDGTLISEQIGIFRTLSLVSA